MATFMQVLLGAASDDPSNAMVMRDELRKIARLWMAVETGQARWGIADLDRAVDAVRGIEEQVGAVAWTSRPVETVAEAEAVEASSRDELGRLLVYLFLARGFDPAVVEREDLGERVRVLLYDWSSAHNALHRVY